MNTALASAPNNEMKNIQEPIWHQGKHKAHELDVNNKLPLGSIIIIINFPKQNTL